MAKDKNKIIRVNNKSDLNTVQKQRAIRVLKDMPLRALLLIDLYLSKMDNFFPKDMADAAKREKTEKNRKVIVTGGELERALGVKSYNKADLLEDIKKLCSVHDLHPEDDNKIVPMSLFNAEGIRAVKENGYWTMEMNCTNAALKYVFIPYGIPYLKYLHFNTPRLSSRYSFFLYQYLESERYKHTEWTVSLEELKKELDCDKQVSYKEFKYFKRAILDRCQKELVELTDCPFEYETDNKGRGGKVVGIKFKLLPKPEVQLIEDKPVQMNIIELEEEGATISEPEIREGMRVDALHVYFSDINANKINNEYLEDTFSLDDVKEIIGTLFELYPNPQGDPQKESFVASAYKQIDDQRKDALKLAYRNLKDEEKRREDNELKPLTSRCKYLQKIIKNNYAEKKASKRKRGNNPRRTGAEAGITLDPQPETKQMSFDDLANESKLDIQDDILDMFKQDDDDV